MATGPSSAVLHFAPLTYTHYSLRQNMASRSLQHNVQSRHSMTDSKAFASIL